MWEFGTRAAGWSPVRSLGGAVDQQMHDFTIQLINVAMYPLLFVMPFVVIRVILKFFTWVARTGRGESREELYGEYIDVRGQADRLGAKRRERRGRR